MKSLLLVALLLAPLHAQEASPSPSPRPLALVDKPQPIYKKWWLWTAAGVVLAVGLAIGLDVGLAPKTPSANTDFGTFRPF